MVIISGRCWYRIGIGTGSVSLLEFAKKKQKKTHCYHEANIICTCTTVTVLLDTHVVDVISMCVYDSFVMNFMFVLQ